MQEYAVSFLGFWALLAIVVTQWLVASLVKAKQPGAIPGKFNQDLSHSSFVFRSHRTFMNSLENLPFMMGTFFLAVFAGVGATFVASCTWVYVCARLVHMVLYYTLKTERNPSPRTHFFLVGFLANAVLFGAVLVQIVSLI